MIDAYLDDYTTIIVEIKKKYYNGKVSHLYLIDNNDLILLDDNLTYLGETNTHNIYRVNLNLDIELGKEYYLTDNYGYKTIVKYRYITKTNRFDEETFTDEFLGCDYSKEKTYFAIWAPISSEVILHLGDDYHKMSRNGSVFTISIKGDHKNKLYSYIIKNNGVYYKVLDPYALSFSYYEKRNFVIDKNDITSNEDIVNEKKSKTIYEVSVRDFTSSKDLPNKGTFNAFARDENLDYLDSLDVEYIQLLPINYFAGDYRGYDNFYNWGYNPLHHNLPHPGYIENINDPISLINETKNLINALHKRGMKVTIDVVFNHVYEKSDNNLNVIVPHYIFLMNDNYEYSNGSFCGNDIDSRKSMVRRYFNDILELFVSVYDVDGFRFDLMGILDIDSINYFYNNLTKLKKNIFLYGEGWNMPSFLREDKRSTLFNVGQLENISFFNDYYRENLKYNKFDESLFKGQYLIDGKNIFTSSNSSINYLQCHDDYAFYDYKRYISLSDEESTIKEQLFKTLIILISNGYAFIGSGQEFYNTKKGIRNTYNSPDEVNTFDWERKKRYQDDIDKITKVIKIREKYNLFECVYQYEEQSGLIKLISRELLIIINNSKDDYLNDYKGKVLFSSGDERLIRHQEIVIMERGNKDG